MFRLIKSEYATCRIDYLTGGGIFVGALFSISMRKGKEEKTQLLATRHYVYTYFTAGENTLRDDNKLVAAAAVEQRKSRGF